LAALASSGSAYVTALYGLTMTGMSVTQLAVMLIVVGMLAITARLSALGGDLRLFMITPQQIVLLLQALGIAVTLFNGQYPDGYVPGSTLAASRWFILGDQAPILVLCLSHIFDMIYYRRIAATRVQFEDALAESDRQVQLLRTKLEMNDATASWQDFTKNMQHQEIGK
jgi:hypothetical protein